MKKLLIRMLLIFLLCSTVPTAVGLYLGYRYLKSFPCRQVDNSEGSQLSSLYLSYFWAAVGALSGTAIIGLFGFWFAVSELMRLLNKLRGKLHSSLREVLPQLEFSESRGDPLSEIGRDIEIVRDKFEEYKQNEVFKEQVERWQEIARRLAHEIKNPLTPILLASQELRKKYSGNDPKYLKLLEISSKIIEEEVTALRRLVDEFSTFAKLPSPNLRPIDLNLAIREFLGRYAWFEGKVQLKCEFEEKPLWVNLDKMLFYQVLRNLIENAIEAGSPLVIVRTGELLSGEVLCQIEDRGKGIPKELQSKIFTPYFTTKKWGSGLGLAITKKIIIDHGGEITASANQEGGATFTIRFPNVSLSSVDELSDSDYR